MVVVDDVDVVVDDVDVDVVVDVDVEVDGAGLVVVVLPVVVGACVVVVDLAVAVVGAPVLVADCGSDGGDGEVLDASHPPATTSRLMAERASSRANRSARRHRRATRAVCQDPTSSSRPVCSGRHDTPDDRRPVSRQVVDGAGEPSSSRSNMTLARS